MLCYRDRTYCVSPCANTDCPRRLTDSIIEEAKAFGLPTAQAHFADSCLGYRAPGDSNGKLDGTPKTD